MHNLICKLYINKASKILYDSFIFTKHVPPNFSLTAIFISSIDHEEK